MKQQIELSDAGGVWPVTNAAGLVGDPRIPAGERDGQMLRGEVAAPG